MIPSYFIDYEHHGIRQGGAPYEEKQGSLNPRLCPLPMLMQECNRHLGGVLSDMRIEGDLSNNRPIGTLCDRHVSAKSGQSRNDYNWSEVNPRECTYCDDASATRSMIV